MERMRGNLNNKGFSIVEIMIAIVILAILCFPILGYFQSSSQYNANAKKKQKGTLAAQSVLEEVLAVGSFEEYHALCEESTDEEYKDYRAYTPAEGAVTDRHYFVRPIEQDDMSFVALIEMDYGGAGYRPNDSDPGPRYNEYGVPDVQSLNSASNVLAVERMQNTEALDELVILSGDSPAEVEADMTRKAVITLEPSSSDDIVFVTMVYRYSYRGLNFETSDKLYQGEMDLQKFKNIYWFYRSFDKDEDVLEIHDELDPTGVDFNYSLILIRQEGSPPVNDSYQINLTFPSLTGLGLDRITRIHANRLRAEEPGSRIHVVSPSGLSENQLEDVVREAKGNRIAKVTISIFQRSLFPLDGSKGFDRDKALVTISSVMGE